MPGIEARAPERTETSSGLARSPNCRAGDAGDVGEAGVDLLLQVLRIFLGVGVVVRADRGGDGEARRHRQAEVGHLGEVRALAAEQVLHAGAALRLAAAEDVDPLAFGPACAARVRLAPALAGAFASRPVWPWLLDEDGRRAINILAVAIRVLVDPSPAFPQSAFLMSSIFATSWPGLSRRSTLLHLRQGVDARHKAGHDELNRLRSSRNQPPPGWLLGSRSAAAAGWPATPCRRH